MRSSKNASRTPAATQSMLQGEAMHDFTLAVCSRGTVSNVPVSDCLRMNHGYEHVCNTFQAHNVPGIVSIQFHSTEQCIMVHTYIHSIFRLRV